MNCIRCDTPDCKDPESKECSDNLAKRLRQEREDWKEIALDLVNGLIVAKRDLKNLSDKVNELSGLMPDKAAQDAEDCRKRNEDKMKGLKR